MRKKTNALLAALTVLVLLAAGAIVAGCGSSDHTTTSGGTSGGAADAAFIADMTPHHQSAIDMAQLARSQADHPALRAMASDIISAQQGEIATMKGIGDDMSAAGSHHPNAHMGMSADEMGMGMSMGDLDGAKPFDRAFIDTMIPHHRGAIRMARVELAKGTHPRLREMARAIISAQSREIAQLRRWRKQWDGSAAAGHGDGTMMGAG